MKYEYELKHLVRPELLDIQAENGWRIVQLGDFDAAGWFFEWVLFERKV